MSECDTGSKLTIIVKSWQVCENISDILQGNSMAEEAARVMTGLSQVGLCLDVLCAPKIRFSTASDALFFVEQYSSVSEYPISDIAAIIAAGIIGKKYCSSCEVPIMNILGDITKQ